jgi:hypothetical protein
LLNNLVKIQQSVGPGGYLRIEADADTIGALGNTARNVPVSDELGANLAEQVISGGRSPQSVLDQVRQMRTDKQALGSIDWYDLSGREILRDGQGYNIWMTENDEGLVLRPVRRTDNETLISPETKEELYSQVPNRAKVRQNVTLPFENLPRHGLGDWIDPRGLARPDGNLAKVNVFGYLKKDHFVPVVQEPDRF